MKLDWQIVRLQLKEKFSISYGDYTYRDTLLVSLAKNNNIGYGECTAIDYYGINLDDFVVILKVIKQQIEKQHILYPAEFYTFLLTLKLPSFLRSALDCAYWDLFGKLEKKSFLDLNKIMFDKLPQSSLTISIASVEEQLRKIEESNWRKFKVKFNNYDNNAIELLLNSNKEIALDANGSFTIADCKSLEKNKLSEKLLYIEQPLKIGFEQYSQLNATKHVNWMADEDSQGISNLRQLKTHYRTINVKLVKVGGLTPALALIKEAKANDFKIMIGCMTESTIGISAGAVLVPLVNFVDLDGANLISNDIATGSYIENGEVKLSEKAGLGISLK